jgi:hypothetical protein
MDPKGEIFDVAAALKEFPESEVAAHLAKVHGVDRDAYIKEGLSDSEFLKEYGVKTLPVTTAPTTTDLTQLSPEALAARNDPLMTSGVGAIAGGAAAATKKGVDVAKALNNLGKQAPIPAPPVNEPYVSAGQKWSSKTGFGAGAGETVREVDEEFKRIQAEKNKAVGSGKISSRITGGSPDEILARARAEEEEIAKQARIRAQDKLAREAKNKATAAAAEAERKAIAAENKFGIINRAGKSLPVTGASVGYNAMDVVNQAKEGDPVQAAIAGTGVIGAAAPYIKKLPPKLRAIGTGVSLLAPIVNRGIDIVEEKAAGGLAGYAGGKAVEKAAKKVVGEVKPLWDKFKYDRYKISQDYPEVIPPVMAIDAKTGKEFLQKQLGPDALEVQKARKAAQKEIDAGNYQPHFDIDKRFYADPSHYPTAGYTQTDIVPKKADTIAKYTELANNPESLARLRGAFEKAKDRPAAKDWYAMGQLEEAFIKELGPEEGRKQFKARFADAMAATTGGADPNSNLMMAAYTNYKKGLGHEIPTKAADLPFPIGGRFVSGNMEQARRLADAGEIPVTNPKRHNFSANFLGHRDVSTLDEQMSQLWDPKMMSPPPNAYGIYQKALADEAKKAGVQPANFQDIAWAGAKDYPGKPMMQEINEMISRTSKITGEPPEEVLKGFIRGNKPMYGIGAAGAGAATQDENMPQMAPGGKVLSSGLSSLRDMIKAEGRTPIVPVPNRWFSQPEKFPHVQGMVNKTLDASQLPREAFHSGAFIDPRTGKVLDKAIYNDVGVLIDPETGRPLMSAGKESGIEMLDPKTGSYTKSNLVRQSLFKPTGGDPMLADMPFIATIEKGDMGHKYGLGTEYATPTEMYNTMTGANPTLRPRSRGDVFGMGDVVGQVQVGGRGIPHDVYEKLFVAPKGSDVPGVKLNKAEGGVINDYPISQTGPAYGPTINSLGFTSPTGPSTQALTPWYNQQTGQTYTAPSGGYTNSDSNWMQGTAPISGAGPQNDSSYQSYINSNPGNANPLPYAQWMTSGSPSVMPVPLPSPNMDYGTPSTTPVATPSGPAGTGGLSSLINNPFGNNANVTAPAQVGNQQGPVAAANPYAGQPVNMSVMGGERAPIQTMTQEQFNSLPSLNKPSGNYQDYLANKSGPAMGGMSGPTQNLMNPQVGTQMPPNSPVAAATPIAGTSYMNLRNPGSMPSVLNQFGTKINQARQAGVATPQSRRPMAPRMGLPNLARFRTR